MLLNIVAITRQLQLTGNIPFSVKSGERKEKIDYLNRKLPLISKKITNLINIQWKKDQMKFLKSYMIY